jgi:hypothetical protein
MYGRYPAAADHERTRLPIVRAAFDGKRIFTRLEVNQILHCDAACACGGLEGEATRVLDSITFRLLKIRFLAFNNN